MKARRSTVLFGVLAAGLVLTQQACTSAGQPVAGPAPSADAPSADAPSADTPSDDATPVPSSKPTTKKADTPPKRGDILAGKRQVVIKPNPSYESIVVVDAKGRLSTTDGEAEHGLFVFTPVGDKFQIKTAKAGAGGEPSCLGVKSNGSNPLTVVAAACDTSRGGQLFTITEQKKKDSEGDPTYAISNDGAFLQIFSKYGLIAQELGDSPLETTYSFVDNGPSKLPALD
ncbi:hypothetical protein [Actinoplanes sp. NBRC 103695]|uniref:hypothetical protein n=1 Tax=Actinoplanes sp. NBRC 103695 TaxID=3032202 RepID=UPI0024A579E0|nr:hypothetical protein [Actinoplanes sp. NBRC 103695]GLY96169.1 hypothetical protein Acsp02_34240 [Actinoplanes sp. NBRC 103695]